MAAVAPERPEIADAREAIRRAADVVTPGAGIAPSNHDAERALTLARMALDRARRALGAGPRRSWREALQPPPPVVAAAVDDRRPSAAPARHAEVDLDSEIPDGHPAKSEIEASVARAFAGVKGRWRVAILVQPHAAWWGLRVEGASTCWTGTVEGPGEQSPEFLAGRVREAVQLGLMQAALPHLRR
jgi:hypothetical protein